MKKSVSQQIAEALEKRAGLVKTMEALVEKSADEGRSFTDSEQGEFDTAKAEIGKLDKQIENLQVLESNLAKGAAPVLPGAGADDDEGDDKGGDQSRAAYGTGARTKSNLAPGMRFARMAIAHAVTKNPMLAADYAKKRWRDTPEVSYAIKAAVDPMSGDETTNSGYLLHLEEMSSEFIGLLRPASIMGRVPARRMEFNGAGTLKLPKQTGGVAGGYVGEGNSIRAQRLAFGNLLLTPSKLAVIVPVSNELLIRSNPSVEMLIRDDIIEGTATTMDGKFLSAAAAGSAPAGILNGITATTVAATTATPDVDEVTSSLKSLILALRNANVKMAAPVWIMNPRTAEYLRLQRTPDSWAWKQEMDQGTLLGYPFIDSTTVPINLGVGTDEGYLVLADAAQLIFADDMAPIIDASDQAVIQSDDAPATPPTPLISAFQQDMTFLRLRMSHTWARRLDVGVAFAQIKF